ncbi:hypothetical protein [Fundidesulfovibrio putealis]|uniref:hypothetical protein n=1 Tax=Fundidesulfovibrio putealis TaxID=270496 RepID=UPI000423A1F6|nr:hypothetical protein [Fundidesulfovibrio putealis]
MEATSQLRQTSSSNQAFDAVKARVVTRSFGVRIGSFGVDYTSKKVEVDPEEQSARKQRDTSGQAFQTEMERERLRREVADAAWNERQNAAVAERADAAGASGDPENEPGTGAASEAQANQTTRQAQETARSEDPLWRRGLSAYAKARDMLLADAARSRGTRLAVA